MSLFLVRISRDLFNMGYSQAVTLQATGGPNTMTFWDYSYELTLKFLGSLTKSYKTVGIPFETLASCIHY